MTIHRSRCPITNRPIRMVIRTVAEVAAEKEADRQRRIHELNVERAFSAPITSIEELLGHPTREEATRVIRGSFGGIR